MDTVQVALREFRNHRYGAQQFELFANSVIKNEKWSITSLMEPRRKMPSLWNTRRDQNRKRKIIVNFHDSITR